MLTAGRVLGALVLVKAVDVGLRGPVRLPDPAWAAALALFVAGGAVLLAAPRRPAVERAGWAGVLLGGVGATVDFPTELRREHLVLVMGVALAALVARDGAERRLLWRSQVSVLYGVAAAAKVNESFLGGDVLAATVVRGPLWSALLPSPPLALLLLAGFGLVATEAWLAVTPWVPRLRRPGVVVAAAFHAGALAWVTPAPLVGLRLVVFGGTALALLAASAGMLPPRRAA